YASQSLQVTLAVFSAGLIATVLAVLPPWPMYNKNPQPWLASLESTDKKDE
ncbi:hypothetical protein DFQ30_002227, partial [Apophysomyces sp. BC1015]